MLVQHLAYHIPQYASIARTVLERRHAAPITADALPGPFLHARFEAPSPALVSDYLAWCGGRPETWRGRLPVHFFPTFTFPQMVRALVGVPQPLARGLNGGVTVEAKHAWRADEPVVVATRLVAIEDDPRRVRIHLESKLGPEHTPDAMHVGARIIVPRAGGASTTSERIRVPADARALDTYRFHAGDGRAYAMLTGDVNPIHVLPAAGRAVGLRGCIQHGYGTMARALESLLRTELHGDLDALTRFEVRWAKPVALPSDSKLFVGEPGTFFVGESVDAPAQMVGRWGG